MGPYVDVYGFKLGFGRVQYKHPTPTDQLWSAMGWWNNKNFGTQETQRVILRRASMSSLDHNWRTCFSMNLDDCSLRPYFYLKRLIANTSSQESIVIVATSLPFSSFKPPSSRLLVRLSSNRNEVDAIAVPIGIRYVVTQLLCVCKSKSFNHHIRNIFDMWSHSARQNEILIRLTWVPVTETASPFFRHRTYSCVDTNVDANEMTSHTWGLQLAGCFFPVGLK